MTDPDPILDRLLALEPTKTWSLIATVFGDLDGEHLSGKALGGLLADLRIKPETARVALHRLKKDGWIETQKSGREVIYGLSPKARMETLAAQEDVYRTTPKPAEGWSLYLCSTDTTPVGLALAIAPQVIVAPRGSDPVPKDCVELTPETALPRWVEGTLVPPHILDQAKELSVLATGFLARPRNATADRALRLMFLHYWRKMALRAETWAHIGLFPEGTMADCHQSMVRVFAETSRTIVGPSEG